MLVDLGRNDLGRVCEYGTVKVDTFMGVETYSHVMHIVSNVSGTLRADVGAMDALRSILPAGTLSGAPKVRAMQIIDELEPVKRGGYGGAIGWLSYAGDLDTCIHIRTVVVKDGVAAHPGRRRHGRRRQARLRVRGVAREVARRPARDRPRRGAAAVAVKVLVIDNYDSFTYNLVQMLGELGAELDVVRNDRADVDELLAREPDRVVVCPGPCTPDEAGISLDVVRRFPEAGVPTLGVCLGHQSMAQAFGGDVVRHEPVHGKTTEITHDGRSLFAGLPGRSTVGALPLARRRRRVAARRVRGQRRGRGRPHGHPPPRAAGGGRPVPSRVGADRRRAGRCCATSSGVVRHELRPHEGPRRGRVGP